MTADALAREALAIDGAARRALDGGEVRMPPRAAPLPAMAVHTLAGGLQDWFVPVVADDRLVASLRFTTQRVCKGTSSFMRQPGRIGDCPLAVDWLDTARIRARAQALASPGEAAGEPLLSFDGVPDRLAWAVPLSKAGAAPRWVFVAGTAAWPAGPQGLGAAGPVNGA